ncbi:MAG: putative ABC transporter permease subunit [Bradymonadia bacterium]
MAERQAPPPWAGFRHLIWPAIRALINQSKHGQRMERLRLTFFALLGISFMLLTGLGAHWLFSQFLQAEFLAELLIRRTLDIILLFFFGLLLFSNLIAGFSTLLLADDLTLLMSSPIPSGRLFLSRLVFNWSQSSWMVIVFGMPVIASAGVVLNAPIWFYPAVPLLLFPFTVIATAVGCLVTLFLAAWLPARRTRDILIVLAVVGFLLLYVAFRLAEPERFLQPDGFKDLIDLITNLSNSENLLTPTTWTLGALMSCAKGNASELVLPTVTLYAGGLTSIALSTWCARIIYLRAFDTAQMGRQTRRESIDDTQPFMVMKYPDGPLSALLARDNRLFVRNAAQWTQLLLIGALVIVYLFNFKHFRALQTAKIINATGIFYVNFALSGLVITTLAVRFLFPAISLEGKAFWTVRVAPFPARTLLWAKVVWGALPLSILSMLLAIGSGWITGLPQWMVITAALLAAVTAFCLSGMAVGLGAVWPAFHLDNPTRIASSIGGVFFMLLGATLLIAVGLLSAPIFLATRDFIEMGVSPSTSRLYWSIGSFIGLCVLMQLSYWLPMRLGATNLDHG